MKISGKPLLNINHLHCKNEKYSRFYREKTAFSPDFSAILLKTLQVGLKNISQKEVAGKLNCKTIDTYWSMQTEVAAPIVAALNNANSAIKEKIKREVYQAVSEKYPEGNIVFDSSAVVICGEK